MKTRINILVAALLAMPLLGCTSENPAVGTWTGEAGREGLVTLVLNPDSTGAIMIPSGELAELAEVRVDGNRVSFNVIYSEGFVDTVSMTGEVDGSTMILSVASIEGAFGDGELPPPVVLNRAQAQSPVGTWTGEQEGRGGTPIPTTLVLNADGTGTLDIPADGVRELEEVMFEENMVSFSVTFPFGGGTTVRMSGVVGGETLRLMFRDSTGELRRLVLMRE